MFDRSGNDETPSNGIDKENGDKKHIATIHDMYRYIKRMGAKLDSLERASELKKECEIELNPLPKRDDQETIPGRNSHEKGPGNIF